MKGVITKRREIDFIVNRRHECFWIDFEIDCWCITCVMNDFLTQNRICMFILGFVLFSFAGQVMVLSFTTVAFEVTFSSTVLAGVFFQEIFIWNHFSWISNLNFGIWNCCCRFIRSSNKVWWLSYFQSTCACEILYRILGNICFDNICQLIVWVFLIFLLPPAVVEIAYANSFWLYLLPDLPFGWRFMKFWRS